jgi:hypothetical protein
MSRSREYLQSDPGRPGPVLGVLKQKGLLDATGLSQRNGPQPLLGLVETMNQVIVARFPPPVSVPNAGVFFERLRLSHMRRDPRVGVTVLDIENWYRAVTVLGRVVDLRDDDGLVDIDRLSLRYRGAPYKNRDRKRVTALIEPERWHEHS